MLIVNADDLGRTEHETDATLACWHAAAISSATHMVWMDDSDRAAALAREAGLPTGLHLNLVQAYTGRDVPPDARERQSRLAKQLSARRARINQLLYDPRLRTAIGAVVRDQLSNFRESFAAEPTHVDGHHHAHLMANVLFSSALPSGTRMRRSLSFLPGERSAVDRTLRRSRQALMARRFKTPDWLFDICDIHPELGGTGLSEKLALSASGSVEVMVHAGVDRETELLLGAEWRRTVAELRPSSYEALG
jgi:predicted glycoside hydrolase/deacetylase ChbG (UPF0249 family)